MSVEDRFNAAVQIIRNLPKNGSFQPPYAMQLTFYSHYKQATEGSCKGSRPSFWDVVGRAKYDAWNGLRSMTKEEAMEKYVSEFVSTIKQLQCKASPEEVKEALSYSEPKHIALFRPLLGDITCLDNVPNEFHKLVGDGNAADDAERHSEDDIEKLDGDHDTDGEDYSDTFNHVQEDGPGQAEIVNGHSVQYQNMKNNNNNNNHIKAGGGDPNSYPPPPIAPYMGSNREPFPGGGVPPVSSSRGGWIAGESSLGFSAGDSFTAERAPSGGGRQPNNADAFSRIQPVDNLSYAVVRLQYTMDEVVRRLDNLERTLQERRRANRWSLLGGIQPHTLAAILLWPVLVQFVLYLLHRRRLRLRLK
ncbi:acyl-CoA-binding domain-containing protein 5-B-like [Varroa jacobsoni]|uniref:ACB domain-containing protein n=1 Tax=Varroa destructor TaxID=109461 RepID=A0A7M7KW15_VARDE|nr:acyl-CoA-binding domain-containing protein 5-B-like [Varroa destructor]XP_022702688.1 acyl-CoA-binding domain-containing protein 5-B-like [Varroa jacobsoni]